MRLIDADAVLQYLREKLSMFDSVDGEMGLVPTTIRNDLQGFVETILEQPTFLAAPRWVRCEDELPKNVANRVLAYCQNGVMYAAHYEGGETDKWYMHMGTWWEEGTGNLTVTHWMPLPEPPREGE